MSSHRQVSIGEHHGVEDYVRQIEELALPPLLAPHRVARLLDMDRRRVYELVEMGEFAAVRHGKRGLRIFRESLLDWLRRRGSGI